MLDKMCRLNDRVCPGYNGELCGVVVERVWVGAPCSKFAEHGFDCPDMYIGIGKGTKRCDACARKEREGRVKKLARKSSQYFKKIVKKS